MPDDSPAMRCFGAAYSGPLAQGDVVYLQSHESILPYIAVVERCEGPQLLCRWFYRYSELPAKLRSTMKPRDVQHELYLSTHADENTRESVLGLCRVMAGLGEYGQTGDVHVCRHTFDTAKQVLVPLRTAKWSIQGPGELAAAPAQAVALIEHANSKKRRCKFPLVMAWSFV